MEKTVLSGRSDRSYETYRSRIVEVGSLKLGGRNPVRIQSMTNTDTNDIKASLKQCEELISAGAEMVRLTTQGKREVEHLAIIRNHLREKGYRIPIVADIHFNPAVAKAAAAVTDKIRINPGNYLKKGQNDKDVRDQAVRQLSDLISTCKSHNTAIRIGVNHGSLSERIMMKYGDTPLGMAESAMEFTRICHQLGFHDLIISLKSSNTRVMIQSVRLLAKNLKKGGLNYPLHLGVTEAGDDQYGRIKSAAGIAPLLLEGIGDTIRVSLTEDPAMELPVADRIRTIFKKPEFLPYDPFLKQAWDPFSYTRRHADTIDGIGGGKPVVIVTDFPGKEMGDPYPKDLSGILIPLDDLQKGVIDSVPQDGILLIEHRKGSIQDVRVGLSDFVIQNKRNPVLFRKTYDISDPDEFLVTLAGELGYLLADGALDAVWIENPYFPDEKIYLLLLKILQASGARISQTEYIACPSCGRTHFDIGSRLQEIKKATSHLRHLKIGVMGCIVNGPGEMADADYGYVGTGRGKITIYKGKEPVFKNIPEEEAIDKMLFLIRREGDWIDH